LVAVDPDAGTIEVSFTATEQFLNPAEDPSAFIRSPTGQDAMDHDLASLAVSLEDDSPVADAQARISASFEAADVRGFVRIHHQYAQGFGDTFTHGRIELAHLSASRTGYDELPGV
jgi:hypothetical protein